MFARVYHPENNVEDFEGYIYGGFHPTHIGDECADGRNRVHNLTMRDYSTVWLAHDQHTRQIIT